jgi:hypothetical protein
LQPGDLLEPGGCRAEHSRFSNRAMEKGYGRWLAWLDTRGLLYGQVVPGDRIIPDRVRTYVADLEAENASGTVIARLIELEVMAAIMDPRRDWTWISSGALDPSAPQAGPTKAASSARHWKVAASRPRVDGRVRR